MPFLLCVCYLIFCVAYFKQYEEKKELEVPAEVKAIAEERFEARKNKDWAKSDELRNKLSELGYNVKDSKDGYELSLKD